MPPRCQNRKIRSGSVALLRLSIFFMRNIQKNHAPIEKIFPEKHCHFSELRIYWKIYRSFLPAPQAGELSSCTAASGGKQAGKAKLPSPPAFCCFSILPVFVFSALPLLRIFALPALLSFRHLRFRHCCRTGFCTSPASLIGPIFPRFRLCHRHGSRLFPALLSSRLLLLFGADHMPVFSLFRNRKQSGAWKFFLCRCSVFGFQRGLLLSLWVFALSFFRSASAGFVQLLPHFLTLDRPGFCPAFVQHWTPFCPAAGGASLIEPLWEASYPPVSIRRGPSVFYPSPK